MGIFIQLSKQQKDKIIRDIQQFYLTEYNEEIGNLDAETLLEFFKKQLGPHYYNLALKDARNLAEQKMLQLEEELFTLERPLK